MLKNFKLTNGFRSYLIKQIQEMDLGQPMRVNIVRWREKRGNSSNSLSHVWYAIIAEFIGDDARSVKAQCKIDFGIPIALQNEKMFPCLGYILDKTGFWRMTRGQQILLISGQKMTSLFDTAEMSKYLNDMQMFWGSVGIDLVSE